MNTFLLILTLIVPGQPQSSMTVGLLRDHRTCQVAGAGMKYILEAANPGSLITWACKPTGEVA